MKELSIVITYDEDLRELKALLEAKGFIVAMPDQVVTAQQIDTLTLFEKDVMSPYDMRAINLSLNRVLLSTNVQLGQWRSASANKDKADQLSAASVDPVGAFDATLNVGEPAPPTDQGAGVIAFDDALNPPS